VVLLECPFCSKEELKVLESRDVNEYKLRRRRECINCGGRFTTYETIEAIHPRIIKKDGKIERFDREKVIKGLHIACEKRPITTEQINKIVLNVESTIRKKGNSDIKSRLIGNVLMNKLKKIDKVAYLRFASVYMDISNLSEFEDMIKNLKD
jgi:transcriptional repressor NrdR